LGSKHPRFSREIVFRNRAVIAWRHVDHHLRRAVRALRHDARLALNERPALRFELAE